MSRTTPVAALFAVAVVGCGVAEDTMAGSPLVGAERIDVSGTGTVQESLGTGRYIYFRLDDSRPEVWYVATGDALRVGDHVSYRG